MLAVSALRSAVKDEHHREVPNMVTAFDDCGFPNLSDANALLESIDFDDLFVGMDDGDVLPDLEMDAELLADFSVEESSDVNTFPSSVNTNNMLKKEEEDKSSGSEPESTTGGGGEVVNDTSGKNGNNSSNSSTKGGQGKGKSRKSSSQSKNSHGKRKVKVDWTPELHRRFVQAVEQLGVDKAVPSRILEIMGIDCLTRHNIASHLQKYRSHRKHLVAREAEAARWRQMYSGTGTGTKRPNMNPWVAPPRLTMGFPPMAPPHLHVWGHPSIRTWPKHQPLPPPSWGPPHSPFCALTPGAPCFPPPTRFGAPHPVQGIPPNTMYKVDPSINGAAPPHRPLFDFQPSKESIDAAIGDVLSKPWLPLPLGLKPPSTDSVMVELQRQGVPKIPPTTNTCSSQLHSNP